MAYTIEFEYNIFCTDQISKKITMYRIIPQRNQLHALGLVALSAILYGFLGYLGTQLLKSQFSVSAMLFWRFFIATAWILLFNFFQRQPTPSLQSRWQALFIPFFLGGLFYSSAASLFFLAAKLTGTGLAMVIFFCYPLVVALLVWRRNKSNLSKLTLFSLALILLGLVLLKGRNQTALSFIGICLGLGAAFCYGLYIVNSKKILTQFSVATCTAIVCLSCTLVFFILALATGTWAWPSSLSALFYVLALGIVATALPIQLLLKGMEVVDPIKASILSVLEPVVTLIVGVALLDELISPLQTLGILIILLGALAAQFSRD